MTMLFLYPFYALSVILPDLHVPTDRQARGPFRDISHTGIYVSTSFRNLFVRYTAYHRVVNG